MSSLPRPVGSGRGSAGGRLAWLIGGLLGCANDADSGAEGSSSTGAGEPRTTMLVPVANSVCDDPKVVAVQARARRIGCEHEPCTVPADPPYLLGDQASCPITEPELELGVVVDESGEYQIDVLRDRTPEASQSQCYAESTQQSTVLVTSIDLDIRAVKMDLLALGHPCPDP
jgi:hypothetical protein